MTPHDCIGYVGIILPERNLWQGAFIRDTPEIRQSGVRLITTLGVMDDVSIRGALQATIVEGLVSNNPSAVAVASYCLAHVSETSFLIVNGRLVGEGYVTSQESLSAHNVDRARQEIENHPQVLKIKERLLRMIVQ